MFSQTRSDSKSVCGTPRSDKDCNTKSSLPRYQTSPFVRKFSRNVMGYIEERRPNQFSAPNPNGFGKALPSGIRRNSQKISVTPMRHVKPCSGFSGNEPFSVIRNNHEMSHLKRFEVHHSSSCQIKKVPSASFKPNLQRSASDCKTPNDHTGSDHRFVDPKFNFHTYCAPKLRPGNSTTVRIHNLTNRKTSAGHECDHSAPVISDINSQKSNNECNNEKSIADVLHTGPSKLLSKSTSSLSSRKTENNIGHKSSQQGVHGSSPFSPDSILCKDVTSAHLSLMRQTKASSECSSRPARLHKEHLNSAELPDGKSVVPSNKSKVNLFKPKVYPTSKHVLNGIDNKVLVSSKGYQPTVSKHSINKLSKVFVSKTCNLKHPPLVKNPNHSSHRSSSPAIERITQAQKAQGENSPQLDEKKVDLSENLNPNYVVKKFNEIFKDTILFTPRPCDDGNSIGLPPTKGQGGNENSEKHSQNVKPTPPLKTLTDATLETLKKCSDDEQKENKSANKKPFTGDSPSKNEESHSKDEKNVSPLEKQDDEKFDSFKNDCERIDTVDKNSFAKNSKTGFNEMVASPSFNKRTSSTSSFDIEAWLNTKPQAMKSDTNIGDIEAFARQMLHNAYTSVQKLPEDVPQKRFIDECLNALNTSRKWERQFCGLLAFQSIVKFEPKIASQLLPKAFRQIVLCTNSKRSGLQKMAVLTLAIICQCLQDKLENYCQIIIESLLKLIKTGGLKLTRACAYLIISDINPDNMNLACMRYLLGLNMRHSIANAARFMLIRSILQSFLRRNIINFKLKNNALLEIIWATLVTVSYGFSDRRRETKEHAQQIIEILYSNYVKTFGSNFISSVGIEEFMTFLNNAIKMYTHDVFMTDPDGKSTSQLKLHEIRVYLGKYKDKGEDDDVDERIEKPQFLPSRHDSQHVLPKFNSINSNVAKLYQDMLVD